MGTIVFEAVHDDLHFLAALPTQRIWILVKYLQRWILHLRYCITTTFGGNSVLIIANTYGALRFTWLSMRSQSLHKAPMRQRLFLVPCFQMEKWELSKVIFLRSLNSDVTALSGFESQFWSPPPSMNYVDTDAIATLSLVPKVDSLSSPHLHYPPGLSTPARSTRFSVQGPCSWKSGEEMDSLFPRLGKTGGTRASPGWAVPTAWLNSSLQRPLGSVEGLGSTLGTLLPAHL